MYTIDPTKPKDRSEYYKQRNAKRTPEYLAWGSIIQRCCNPSNKSYVNYGGRGITVCERWRGSAAAFLEDMGERPSKKYSVERIDNEKGYSKENCKWATAGEQMRNNRRTRILTVNGESLPLVDWADRMGLSRPVLAQRIDRHGWSVEDAVLTPADCRYRHNVKDASLKAPKGPMGSRGNIYLKQ